ncbi:Uncharacterised protein [Cedecea neteri]|uniref:Uncharacterized protein n=1 Tax=Cedecea neteri TaxID=158822 RepID=A0A2X2T6V6_9ENTR|nr:Uncharacterised protein [Cedecea neteri]
MPVHCRCYVPAPVWLQARFLAEHLLPIRLEIALSRPRATNDFENVLLFAFMTYALLMLFNDGTANTLSRL